MTPFVLDRPETLELSAASLGDVNGLTQRPVAALGWLWRPRAPKLTSSPWGAVVDSAEIASGITWFKTATRRGYRLSARRQAALPRYLRTEDGWYENVSEWAAVAVVFDRIFDKAPADAHGRSLYHAGKETLKNWQPEEYEDWFQTTLDMDVIWSLAVTKFHRLHADRWIVLDVVDDRHAFVPHGHLHVRAKLGGDPPYGAEFGAKDSASRWFLVAADEFTQMRGKPFLIDPARHREVDAPDPGGAFPS